MPWLLRQAKKQDKRKMKLNLMGRNHSDNLNTPEWTFKELIPYIPKGKILECAVGNGEFLEIIKKNGFEAVGTNNFFEKLPDFDIIITNPPYSIKDEFLKRAYELNKPFAFLLPITALEGQKRQLLYKKYGIQIIFPIKRTDFNGKGRPWFYTAWFCWKFNLPNDLIFKVKFFVIYAWD